MKAFAFSSRALGAAKVQGDRKALVVPAGTKHLSYRNYQQRISPFAKGDQGFAVALDLRGDPPKVK